MMTSRYHGAMRTTVVIDGDVAAEIERLRREGLGVSAALNLLARRGMAKDATATTVTYQHRTSKIGLKVGLVARCTISDLEAGVSARNGRDWKRTRHTRSPWPQATIDQDVMDRALEVQGALAVEGLHRTVKLGDLLIAAAAERARLVVLHYDPDFDRIATITGQPTEWVAPPGTVD
jgi:predicted nucleic acid-binding protein